jgi:heme oxygenase
VGADVTNGVMARLRRETGPAHARLEGALDLLRPPLRAARFADLLDRFHSFHRDWEPAVAARLGPEIVAGRGKLALLEEDLRRLGRVPSVEECPAAILARTRNAALGSLYVLEGSTLGGQVIGRALRDTEWAAPGLRYFDPYGAGTKTMWAAFKEFVELNSPEPTESEIVAGAVATFDFLHFWLASATRRAA